MIPFAKPLIGPEEIGAVVAALHNTRLTEGPLVEEFERAFGEMHGGHAVAVSSCTAALQLAGPWVFPQPGKSIQIPAMTHVATAHALDPFSVQFIDCDVNGTTMGADLSVSFLGAPCMPADVQDLATGVGMPIKATMGCYSFYPSKHITTGEGGMVVCRHSGNAATIRLMRAFGKTMTDGKFDVVARGLNFRMSEIAAALGIEQLKKLPGWLEIRKRNWHALADELPGEFRILDTSGGAYYALAAYVPDGVDRDDFRQRLLAKGVETSVYYPVPVPHLTYYRERYGHKIGDFPNAERISSRSVAFPVAPHIGYSEIEQIVKAVKESL